MDILALKAAVGAEIERLYDEMASVSRRLHENPEVAFEEHQSSALLEETLERHGFTVSRGVAGLSTAFRADYGKGRPTIAFLAEYDALPGLGHACGHNLIAASSLAAAISLRRAVDALGGSVAVFGTPGEELYGGKVIMAAAGAFDAVDVAMLAHPGGGNRVLVNTLACQNLEVEFFGVASHAAEAPHRGVNALDAMVLAFNAINALRQHLRAHERVSGIITDGGEAANIIPAHSAGVFIVRAEDDTHLEALKKKVITCFEGAAEATGARLESRWGERYAAMVSNVGLGRLFYRNMRSLGVPIRLGDRSILNFSTDVGNVSQLVPAIQPMVPVAPDDVLIHTPRFAEVAASDRALRRMLDAARAMAMTGVDLLGDPGNLEKVRDEFLKGR
ncbi:MAG: M20 family metallopeptidase [Dehalococcoidales bacterium]|nr:M20 family metallopeptidase [Dehalococcoidales bacterium]